MLARSLASLVTLFLSLSALPGLALPSINDSRVSDPCATIAGQKWAAPSDVRACFTSFRVDPVEKANILTASTRILDFHTSTNYQIRAPQPFTADVHEDIIRDLQRINETEYENDLDLHIDISRSFKKLNDGHVVYINYCYDGLYSNFIPLPLVHLTDKLGFQHVHIAPEAFGVTKAEFHDQIDFWQNALPGDLKGNLESLNGAKVLLIDGKLPYVAVDENAAITGSFQGLGTRQNSFFSSYSRAAGGWTYVLGQFASQSLPLSDYVELTILREGKVLPETFTVPFRSRISTSAVAWTDSASFRAKNCKATAGTNGVDYYASSPPNTTVQDSTARAQQQPKISPDDLRKHPLNVILDATPPSDITLPPELVPASPPLGGSYSVAQFYYLNETQTGVLALGSFSAASFADLQTNLLVGLQNLKAAGAKQLIVDVTNNGGGFICVAHWLHRIITGAKSTTEPQAGLYTEARDQPLARAITAAIANGADPEFQLLYNPTNWAFGNNSLFPEKYDWLKDPVRKVINDHEDFFSQKLGQECQPFSIDPPAEALFDPKKTVVVSNGRCASSCSLFSITMNKLEGTKAVVFGGRNTVKQQYCGTVGGQSTNFATINSEIKSAKLKGHSLSPPDFLTNSVVGITWRLGFGIWNPEQPEEWEDHPANVHLDLTKENVNNPLAIWNDVIKAVF
ncbi:hypothetical protein BDM02DRAFT_3097792 [Thelephora ganbajun]|uniref:Uncharacterized protein n=1 Tax=Thelephora ganbajun TaxID=370292 RepID=A0ACB6ZDJ7_THEGA|nr:hypothetical protein BDM02DRAFT_3097792 [Thelephora ganbajun]